MCIYNKNRKLNILVQVPKFNIVGQTLVVRLDNEWPNAGSHSLNKLPNEGKLDSYCDHNLARIVVICSLYEPTHYRPNFFSEFAHSLRTHNPELVTTPLHYLVHCDAELGDTQDHSITQIDSFEYTTKLIYDLSTHKHGNTTWHPYTKKLLFLPGKLRPVRYTALRELLEQFPHELVYTLNRRLVCNIDPMHTDQRHLDWWIKNITQLYHNHPSGISAEEVIEFALAHETEPSDTDRLRMHDHTQMFSQQQLETTSLSVIAETVPWMTRRFFTEKTYAPIAAGRPFAHYHELGPYLHTKGYRLFCNTKHKTQWIRDFLYQPDIEHTLDTITHNLRTLHNNCADTLNKIVEVFPEFGELSPQQQINTLITFQT